eukprot:TRINITY_DN6399_c0_g1_i1.p1 TRINITY_DN6399_c0_g1~~TRINITY_DN6399_c0_g1_i1.p1  ORF type:complete len:341 (+),score=84.83 TRINITY_DN6399_c0_g1_i1:63-1085(+)
MCIRDRSKTHAANRSSSTPKGTHSNNNNNRTLTPNPKPATKYENEVATTITTTNGNRDSSHIEEAKEQNYENLYIQSYQMLSRVREADAQHSLLGYQNIWIVKPAGLSRGRGIHCLMDLRDIFEYIKIKDTQWVAQKYIEYPLVIHRKKFDIRQWVLVTDWSPLTVWFYDECYVRFSAEDYDPNNVFNRFVHLTNNSVAKHSQHFYNAPIEGNMWTCQQFSEYLSSLRGGVDVFKKEIQPGMKQIVAWSLLCVQDMVEQRKNSLELYGYDFMVDEDLRPWLIEINSSPDFSYSTKVTERLVKMASEDIVKVIVDYRFSKNKASVNTGLFKCIYKGKMINE